MKAKNKIFAILSAIILIAVASGFAYLYFFTDMFKTPQEMFNKYVGKLLKDESEYSYQDILNQLKETQNKSYKSNSTIGLELKTRKTDYASRKQQVTYDEINKLKLKVETQNVPKDENISSNIQIEYNDEGVTEIEFVKNSNLYGIKSEFLDDKYIAVKNEKLQNLMKKLGQTSINIPNQVKFVDLYDLLYISQEDQDKIINTYKDIVLNNISADNYKKVENIIQKVNNKDINTTVYVLGLNQKEACNIVIQILEAAKQDETLMNLIVDKASKIENVITKGKLIDGIEEKLEELKENMEEADESSIMEFVLYVADEDVVRVELKQDNVIIAAIDVYKEEDKNYIELYSNQSNYDTELEKILKLEYKTNKNNDEKIAEGKITINNDGEETEVSFNIKTKGEVGQGKNETLCEFSVQTEDLIVKLKIDSEIEYTDDVKTKKINEKNIYVLNNMKETEIQTLFNKVAERFQKTLIKKLVGLGILED